MRGLLVGLALIGSAVVATSSCVVELNHVVACGDGYIDPEVGEECEPGEEDSFADACDDVGIAGVAGCDLETCTQTCVGCGDGIVQGASDGELLAEECDEGVAQNSQTAQRECAALGDPLEPWRAGQPYASGESSVCTAACYYDRLTCSYCGDGVADGSLPLAPDLAGQMILSLPEKCDGESLSADFITSSGCPPGSEPNVVCAADCQGTTERAGPDCCVRAGQPCEDPALCCHAYAHPDDTLHCENPLTGNGNAEPGMGGSTCR